MSLSIEEGIMPLKIQIFIRNHGARKPFADQFKGMHRPPGREPEPVDEPP